MTRKIEVFAVPGTVIVIDGQSYAFNRTGTTPAGNPIVYWDTGCFECGTPIEAFAPPGSLEFNRRCHKHAKPGRPVIAKEVKKKPPRWLVEAMNARVQKRRKLNNINKSGTVTERREKSQ